MKLPDGPGSVRGLSDGARVDVFSGQVGYSVPLDLPAGIAGFGPKLSLTYSGDLGNGPLGVGWAMPQVVLRRATRLGVPAYTSADELELAGVGGGGRLVALPDGTWRVEGQGHTVKVARDGTGYVVTENGGVRYRMGVTAAGRQAEGSRVAAWHVEEVLHPNGQTTAFSYLQHNGQQYLSDVTWGPDAAFRAEFVYGTRPDTTVSYRTGFKVESAQRLTEVRVHSFGELLRAYVLGYDNTFALSRLKTVTQLGRGRMGAMPTLTLDYAPVQAASTVQMEPASGWYLATAGTSLMDVDGDGMTDLVRLTGSGHQWRRGTGTGFGSPRVLSGATGAVLATSRFLDVDGDARPELVRNFSEAWQINRLQGESFGSSATKWAGTDGMPLYSDITSFADINGDGRVDVVRAGSDSLSVRWNRNTGLSAPAQKPAIDGVVLMPGPNTRFHEVNGDGLADVVQLSSNWFKGYLGKGDGTFVAGTLQSYPWGDNTNPANVRLADLNRDGLMDLVHVLNGYVHWYRGKAGGGVEATATRLVPPGVDGTSTVVTLADLNGNGSEDVVWSGPDGMWALDLAGPTTAGMLVGINNGLGKTVALQYQSSAALTVAAEGTAQAWTRRFPTSIPVPVRMTVNPGAGGPSRVEEYTVRDGFWDSTERRFGGFLVGGVRTLGTTALETLYEETRYHEGGGNDRSLRGLALEVRREDGLHTLFSVATSVYEARPINGLPNVPLLRRPALIETRTRHHEGVSTPLETLTTYMYDERVRPIEEKSFGRLDLTGDERTVQRSYASDDTLMVQDALCEETLREADGSLVSRTRTFYGDANQVFTWTDPNLCRAGRLVRETHGFLDGVNPRWVLQSATETDVWDNPTRIYAQGVWRTLTYDAHHLHVLTETQRPNATQALTWTLAWDDVLGQARTLTTPDGVATEVSYDSLGRPVAVAVGGEEPHLRYVYDWTHARPQTSTYIFDGPVSELTGSWAAGWMDGGKWRQSVTVSNGAGETLFLANRLGPTRWSVERWQERDARGLVVYAADAYYWDGATLPSARPAAIAGQTMNYDALGRLIAQQLPTGTLRSFSHNAFHSTQSEQDLASLITSWDGLGRTRRTERLVGTTLESVDAAYDAADRIRALHLQDGAVTHGFTYDSLGRLVSAQDPDIGPRTLSYDDHNRLTGQTNGANQTRLHIHDDIGRLIRTEGEDGTAFIYHYDTNEDGTASGYVAGRTAWVEEPAGKVHLAYDAWGRTIWQHRTIDGRESHERTTFSPSGLLLTSEVDGAVISMDHDAAGRPIAVGNLWQALQLDASGRVLEERYGNGVRQVYARDALGMPSRIQTLRSLGTPLYDVTLTRNAYGAPKTITDSDGSGLNHSATFTYDAAARLSDVVLGAVPLPGGMLGQGTESYRYGYQYDGLQNMVQREAIGPQGINVLAGTYHHAERGFGPRQLTRVASVSGDTLLDYDPAGRQVRQGGRQMTYNGLDQLIRVSIPGSGATPAVVEHAYGHDGLRVKTRGPLGDTQYWFSSQLTERPEGMRERYVRLGDRVLARLTLTTANGGTLAAAGGNPTVDRAVGNGLQVLILGVLGLVLASVVTLRASLYSRFMRGVSGLLTVALLGSACGPGIQAPGVNVQRQAHWLTAGTLYFHGGVAAGPVLTTREDGSVHEERRYEPFGAPVDAYREFVGGGSAMGLVDHEDEPLNILNRPTDAHTGWSDHGARWTAPETGRWLTPDPPVKTPDPRFLTSPWGLHPYQYVRQNPVLFWDPDGRQELPFAGPGPRIMPPMIPPGGGSPFVDPAPYRPVFEMPGQQTPLRLPPAIETPPMPIRAPPPGFWGEVGGRLLRGIRFVTTPASVFVTVALYPSELGNGSLPAHAQPQVVNSLPGGMQASSVPLPGSGPTIVSPSKGPLRSVPFSRHVQVIKTGDKAVQIRIYDENGDAVGDVDFKNHSGAGSGHGHMYPPQAPGSGHGSAHEHIPHDKLPAGWSDLPNGVTPVNPIGK
ncbi:FG-GAP-like repeat-containing protein [Corallococcus sicarius]|uniref:FG-GAP-like repeat-containing protein n=1 Tax=Corallococcus sicarius TaxID=2316726 RepID=UPI001315795D|nr:FG-GAP-like repeat-containing protein [Corallococcus sicarius]